MSHFYIYNLHDRVRPSQLYRDQFPRAKHYGGSITSPGDDLVMVKWDDRKISEELHVSFLIPTGENWPAAPERGKPSQKQEECRANMDVLRAAVFALREIPWSDREVAKALAIETARAMNSFRGYEPNDLMKRLASFGFVVPYPKRFIDPRYDERPWRKN